MAPARRLIALPDEVRVFRAHGAGAGKKRVTSRNESQLSRKTPGAGWAWVWGVRYTVGREMVNKLSFCCGKGIEHAGCLGER